MVYVILKILKDIHEIISCLRNRNGWIEGSGLSPETKIERVAPRLLIALAIGIEGYLRNGIPGPQQRLLARVPRGPRPPPAPAQPEGLRRLDHRPQRLRQEHPRLHPRPPPPLPRQARLRPRRRQPPPRPQQGPRFLCQRPHREHPPRRRGGQALRRCRPHLHRQPHLPLPPGSRLLPRSAAGRHLHRSFLEYAPGGVRVQGSQGPLQARPRWQNQRFYWNR